jgi:VanZ family protein
VPEQPWRNPRPAPQLSEFQSRVQAPHALIKFWAWFPAIFWACVIFFMSTDTFSSEHTALVFEPLLHWLIPSLSQEAVETIHHLIRKSAHFTEYFVFCLLLYRGIRGGRKGWRWSWGLSALFIAAVYSALDEIHQAFVISRTASPYDSLLDSIGAFFAVLILFLWFRLRMPKSEPAVGS